MTPPAQKVSPWLGWLFVAVGVGTGLLIHHHPEGLNAPAWVAYLACATFAFAGLAVVLQAHGLAHYSGILAWLIVISFAVIGLWIGVGPGERTCSGSISVGGLGDTDTYSGLGCRIPFGIGGGICALLALAMVPSLWRHLKKGRTDPAARPTEI